MSIEILTPQKAQEWLKKRHELLTQRVTLNYDKILIMKKVEKNKQELNKLDSELIGQANGDT